MIKSVIKSVERSLIGSPQLAILLSRVTLLADDRKEPGNGCWIRTSSRSGSTKATRRCSAQALQEQPRPLSRLLLSITSVPDSKITPVLRLPTAERAEAHRSTHKCSEEVWFRNSLPYLKAWSLYERHNDKRIRLSLEDISKVLHSVVTDYSRAFTIIDALDEC